MTWDIMMDRYHVSHTMIAKYRKAALKELDKQYELRDRIGEVVDDMVMEQITVALQIQIGAYAEYN